MDPSGQAPLVCEHTVDQASTSHRSVRYADAL